MKIKLIAFACIMITMLTGCNKAYGIGNYSFKKIHIDMDGVSCCLDIKSWHDTDGAGIEANTKDYGSLFLSEGTYILVEDECPICDSKTKGE